MSALLRRSLHIALGLVLVLLFADKAKAQCLDWVQRYSTFGPGSTGQNGSGIGTMAYDEGRGLAMGFGWDSGDGNCNPSASPCSWLWNGSHWADSKGEWAGLYPRQFNGLVYDAGHDYVLLVGGFCCSPSEYCQSNETWSWDGTGWTYRGTSPASSRYPYNKIAYDAARQEVVLFGGSSAAGGYGYTDETWVWDGASWIQRFPDARPSARDYHAMAYDSAHGVTVLFGGQDSGGVMLSDTWEWDGTNWTQRTPAISPSMGYAHAMAYDSARNVTVLFGGYAPTTGYSDDTWEWDGETWTLQNPSVKPPARSFHKMVFDSRRGKIVVYGGACINGNCGYYSSVWEYPAAAHARILSQPTSQTTCLRESVTFTVSATGDPPLSYQWRRDGVDLNLPGAQSPTLTLTTADFGSMGDYACVVTNPCGSVESTPASLTLCAGPDGCPQPLDVNGDGVVDGADIQRFVEVLLGL